MKVRAVGEENKVVGYYGGRKIYGGMVFLLKPKKISDKRSPDFGKVISVEQQFSEKWMEKVGGKSAAPVVENEIQDDENDLEDDSFSQSDEEVI